MLNNVSIRIRIRISILWYRQTYWNHRNSDASGDDANVTRKDLAPTLRGISTAPVHISAIPSLIILDQSYPSARQGRGEGEGVRPSPPCPSPPCEQNHTHHQNHYLPSYFVHGGYVVNDARWSVDTTEF